MSGSPAPRRGLTFSLRALLILVTLSALATELWRRNQPPPPIDTCYTGWSSSELSADWFKTSQHPAFALYGIYYFTNGPNISVGPRARPSVRFGGTGHLAAQKPITFAWDSNVPDTLWAFGHVFDLTRGRVIAVDAKGQVQQYAIPIDFPQEGTPEAAAQLGYQLAQAKPSPAAAAVTRPTACRLPDHRRAAESLLREMCIRQHYRLHYRQSLVRIAPPFHPTRVRFFQTTNPGQMTAHPKGPSGMVFRFEHAQLLKHPLCTFGSGAFKGFSLGDLLDALLPQTPHPLDDPAELAKSSVPGDWILRQGTTPQETLAQLESILRKELALPIRLQLRRIERPVYVAEGTYQFSAVAERAPTDEPTPTADAVPVEEIQIVGKQPSPERDAGEGNLAQFLDALGAWIAVPIVSEVRQDPAGQLHWSFPARWPETAPLQPADRDPQSVLRQVTAQTGLTFRQVQRTVDVLSLTTPSEHDGGDDQRK